MPKLAKWLRRWLRIDQDIRRLNDRITVLEKFNYGGSTDAE